MAIRAPERGAGAGPWAATCGRVIPIGSERLDIYPDRILALHDASLPPGRTKAPPHPNAAIAVMPGDKWRRPEKMLGAVPWLIACPS